jgi:Signal transduction histidine kinase
MAGRRLKSSLVILIYSIILTTILLLGIYLYISVSKPSLPISAQNIALFQSSDVLLTAGSNGTVTAPVTQAVSVETLNSYYQVQFLRYLPAYILVLVLTVFALSFLMWKIIRKIETQQTLTVSRTVRIATDIEGRRAHALDYGRLNSYISHEQKNALSLLRAKLELRGDGDLVKTIETVSNHIDDVLTLSSNVDPLYEVDATIVCAEAVDSYKKIYPKIRFDFNEDENFTIQAKEVWIHRAVFNLIDNAIKYGDGSEVAVAIKSEKGSVIITVHDNGIGIDKSLYGRIFDDRFRIGVLKKDGYGIGLSLVRHVCELCSGICYLESESGTGTTFYLVFPQA